MKLGRVILALCVILMLFEGPRSSVLNALSGLGGGVMEAGAKSKYKDVPATLELYAFTGGYRGFATRDGFIFSCDESIRSWNAGDIISWSYAGDGRITMTNSRTGQSVGGRLSRVDSLMRGY